ncbi:Arginase/deacetylase [Clavulina sp. PMI_390]|nr:Arginase/deacetylase [Clavulina sp. PMI_390]
MGRQMYIDLDLHFSDGVSEAFMTASKSPSVLTLSIHHAAPGFYPTSPHAALTPVDTPNPFNLAIPLLEGASNDSLHYVWKNCVVPVKDAFSPDFVVLQCGVDGLAGDPCAVWNLGLDVSSAGSLGNVVGDVINWGVPTLLLGGGGYDSPNAARAWAYLTSVACGSPLALDTSIPEHSAFPQYAPSFMLEVLPGNRLDLNTPEYLTTIENNFNELAARIKALCNT